MRPQALVLLTIVAMVGLLGCATSEAEQAARERDAARLQLLGDSVFYWRCEHRPVVVVAECSQLWRAYKSDLAVFAEKYGAPTNPR